LAREQGVKPFKDGTELEGAIPDEDVDALLSDGISNEPLSEAEIVRGVEIAKEIKAKVKLDKDIEVFDVPF
jgi:hypothetical protein